MNPSLFAQKNILRSLQRLCIAFCICCVFAVTAHAESSNRNQVRANVASGGWEVIWGVTINEAEYFKAASSIYAGNPAAYFSHYLDRNIEKVAANAPSIGKQALKSAITRALRGRQQVRIGDIGIKAGIVSYQRWKMVSAHVPNGTEKYKIKGPFGTWTWGWRPKMKLVKKRIPLPNHHQPYIAFRLYKPGPTHLDPRRLQPRSNGNRLVIHDKQFLKKIQEESLRRQRIENERRRRIALQNFEKWKQLKKQQNQIHNQILQKNIKMINQTIRNHQLNNHR